MIIGVIATVFLFISNVVAVPQTTSKTIISKFKNSDITPFGLIAGTILLLISLWFTFQGLIGSLFSPMGVFILILGLIGDVIAILTMILL